MDYHQSLWVYGDNREPNLCRVMYALHPVSFRWFVKYQQDPRDAPGHGLTAWEPLQSEPLLTINDRPVVRCHRQNGQVRFPRRASLPTDNRSAGWLKYVARKDPSAFDYDWADGGRRLANNLQRWQDVHRKPIPLTKPLAPVSALEFPGTTSKAKAIRVSGLPTHYNCRINPLQYKEEPTMTTANAAIAREQAARATLPADVRYIGVRFLSGSINNGPGNTYTYLSQDQSIEVGDHALVMSPSGLATVKVVSTNATRQGIEHAYKWLVSRVDPAVLEAYKSREVRQAEIETLNLQIARQRKQAIARLNERALAEADPELARLLAQRDALEGVVPAEKPAEASFGSLSVSGVSKDSLTVTFNK